MDIRQEDLELLRREVRQVGRQNRWLAVFSGLIGLALVLSFVMPIDTLRARRFELFNERDRREAMWRVQDDTTAMILSDNAGRWRAVLSMDREGPRLDFNSPLGEPLVSLSTPDSAPTLSMRDVEGRQRVRIVVDAEGARIQFFDEQGEVIASYPDSTGR